LTEGKPFENFEKFFAILILIFIIKWITPAAAATIREIAAAKPVSGCY
jgi:hypothetical protein